MTNAGDGRRPEAAMNKARAIRRIGMGRTMSRLMVPAPCRHSTYPERTWVRVPVRSGTAVMPSLTNALAAALRTLPQKCGATDTLI